MPKIRITGIPQIEYDGATKKVKITKVPTKFKAQSGGQVPETEGLPDNQRKYANVEAEGGEVYQNQGGNIIKIKDNAPDHEEGGVALPDAERVLEDTANKRGDKFSKALKMSPDEVQTIFGFKPKKALSHAKAYEAIVAQYGKQIGDYNKKLANTNDEGDIDKLSANTVRLNILNRDATPTPEDVFDTLFEHQEAIKATNGIPDDGKAKYGGFKPSTLPKAQYGNGTMGLYTGPKNPAHKFTPTGKTSEAKSTEQEIRDAYKSVGVDLGNASGAALQQRIYEYLIENQPEALRATLKEYGANSKAINAGKGNLKAFTDPMNASKADLQEALPYLIDALPGARIPKPSVVQQDTTVPGKTTPPTPGVPAKDPTVDVNYKPRPEPTNDYPGDYADTSAASLAYGDSLNRDPELYNPIKIHQLKYKLLNPSAALYSNQSDFEAAAHSLEDSNLGSGVNAANLSNLTAQKYKANNQILGQYENENVGIQNREIDYNTNARDRQSMADAQSRSEFYSNVLRARDNQRLQRLQSVQDISRAQQLQARQNSSLKLISKLSPAFDKEGDYNGYEGYVQLPSTTGIDPTDGTVTPSTTVKGPSKYLAFVNGKYIPWNGPKKNSN